MLLRRRLASAPLPAAAKGPNASGTPGLVLSDTLRLYEPLGIEEPRAVGLEACRATREGERAGGGEVIGMGAEAGVLLARKGEGGYALEDGLGWTIPGGRGVYACSEGRACVRGRGAGQMGGQERARTTGRGSGADVVTRPQ